LIEYNHRIKTGKGGGSKRQKGKTHRIFPPPKILFYYIRKKPGSDFFIRARFLLPERK